MRRLEALPLAEWRQTVDDLVTIARAHPAEVDIDTLGDDDLNARVHEVRAGRAAK